MIRAFSWIVGGLTVVALTAAGDAAPRQAPADQQPPVVQAPPARQIPPAAKASRRGLDLNELIELALESSFQALEKMDMEEILSRSMEAAARALGEVDLDQILSESMEAARLGVEDASLALQGLDLEEALQEARWALEDMDWDELEAEVQRALESVQEIEIPQIPPLPPPPPPLPDIEWPDIEFEVPEIDFELEMPEFDFEFEVPEIEFEGFGHGWAPRAGRGNRLELLEMTVEQQGDPGVAKFNEAKTLIFDEKYLEARERLLELIRDFPNSSYLDDAFFWASYALEQIRGQSEAAFKSYEEFVAKYPQSPFVEHARASMIQLAERLYRQGMEAYKQYIESARTGEEDEVQLYALQALSRMEGYDVIPSIEAILADGSKSSRLKREAVSMLRRIDDPRAVQVLETAGREHADPAVRRSSISALGNRRDQASLQALTRLYQGEKSVNARRYIADAAGNFRRTDYAAEAASFLARVAGGDDDENVRRQALGELARFDSSISMTHLRSLLDGTAEPDSRRMLLSAIARSEDPSALGILAREARTGSDEKTRRYAVDALGDIEGPEALDALISIARSDLPEAVRVEAVDEIGNNEGSKATNVLVEIARSSAPERVVREAIDELGNRRTSEVFETLREIVAGDAGSDVRRSALSGLRRWGARAVPVLEQIALNDAEMSMRRDAVSALGRMENAAGWDSLVRIYKSDADSRLRRTVLDYLWRISEERSMSTVIEAAKSDRDSSVRRHAVQLLGRSDSAEAKKALKEILGIPPAGGK